MIILNDLKIDKSRPPSLSELTYLDSKASKWKFLIRLSFPKPVVLTAGNNNNNTK